MAERRRTRVGSRKSPNLGRRSRRTTDDRQPAIHAGSRTADDRLPAAVVPLRVVVENIRPAVDGGRFPVKRTIGEAVTVRADIYADGHDVVVAVLRDRPLVDSTSNPEPGTAPWRETRMAPVAPGTDEWAASFTVDELGWHEYSIVAWVDRFRTWRHDLDVKVAAGQDVALELIEGLQLVREAARRAEETGATAGDANRLQADADVLCDTLTGAHDRALHDELVTVMDSYANRSTATVSQAFRVWVDRERARFSTWYEMFPRSAGPDPSRSGTLQEAAALLPAIADLGFDVLYLPPIHPIGHRDRKGPGNRLLAESGDPGSPWAIGSDEGGHTAIDRALGTMADFEMFRAEAVRLGLEIALDLAFQVSPDHPWVREHPEWFHHRPDGSVKPAENPPKKYQDIYPLDFVCDDWRALWQALLAVTRFWIDRGVRIFRVDNPHTKPFAFWEWLIGEVHAGDPDVIFLSEAFTRPKPMRYLAKAGFTQSYTYFTWRNTKDELTAYFSELTATDEREYFRPNLFVNTPDILHAYLQRGGRPAFEARLLLAATLGASYGMYSGFELCEARAVPGTEEYADSEKYQYRKWDWDRPGNIKELIARVNQIRRRHLALQSNDTLRFHATDNPHLVAYSKSPAETAPGLLDPDVDDGMLLMIVNLDPHHTQQGFVEVPIDRIAAAAGEYEARDLLDDAVYLWRGGWNYVRLDPGVKQGHILRLEVRRGH
jgi:starch synthase (maltosyl-transferring)